MAEKVHPAEEDRYGSTTNKQSTDTIPVEAMTYVEGSNGNIVPGEGVGLTPQSTPVVQAQPETPVTTPVTGEQQPVTTPAVTETPETKPAYNPADYLVDWGKLTPQQAYDLKKHSINDLMYDQQKWAKATGNDFNWFPWAGLSKDQDINKTKAENEEDERKAKAKARWDSIGRFIRELGNFVGVAGFGGQSIPSKEASPEEYTARQKQLRDATIAARNTYNKNFFADFTKQMADDYNKQKLEIEKRKQDRLDEDQRLKTRKQDWLEKFQQGRLDIDREKMEIEREYKEGRIKQGEKANALRELEYYRKAAGTTTTTTNKDGSVTVRTTTPGTKGKTSTSSTTPKGNNAPPSRRQSGSNNNTPPSRRKQ